MRRHGDARIINPSGKRAFRKAESCQRPAVPQPGLDQLTEFADLFRPHIVEASHRMLNDT